ncbi:MAG: DNA polymerase III subunit delta [Clostridiales bacterium]|nr:DNA polymerase III subunit delta [Clostridiales bacterium]
MAAKTATPGGASVLRKFIDQLEKGAVRGAVLLFGREQYLVKKAMERIMEACINDAVKDLDFTRIDPANLTVQTLQEQCETLPIFSPKRVVLIPDFPPLEGKALRGFGEKDEEALLKYMDDLPESCLLVFTSGKVDKRLKLYKKIQNLGGAHEFGPMEKADLEKFAARTLKPYGKTMDAYAFRTLLDLTGYYPDEVRKNAAREVDYTLYHLENDLKKLAGVSPDPRITEEDVTETIGGNLELDVFRILDSAAEGKKGESLLQLRSLLRRGEPMYRILALLCSQLEIFLVVKEMKEAGRSTGEMVSALGVHEFRVKKSLPVVSRYTVAHLRQVLQNAMEVDGNVKRGKMDGNVALELLIAQL